MNEDRWDAWRHLGLMGKRPGHFSHALFHLYSVGNLSKPTSYLICPYHTTLYMYYHVCVLYYPIYVLPCDPCILPVPLFLLGIGTCLLVIRLLWSDHFYSACSSWCSSWSSPDCDRVWRGWKCCCDWRWGEEEEVGVNPAENHKTSREPSRSVVDQVWNLNSTFRSGQGYICWLYNSWEEGDGSSSRNFDPCCPWARGQRCIYCMWRHWHQAGRLVGIWGKIWGLPVKTPSSQKIRIIDLFHATNLQEWQSEKSASEWGLKTEWGLKAWG